MRTASELGQRQEGHGLTAFRQEVRMINVRHMKTVKELKRVWSPATPLGSPLASSERCHGKVNNAPYGIRSRTAVPSRTAILTSYFNPAQAAHREYIELPGSKRLARAANGRLATPNTRRRGEPMERFGSKDNMEELLERIREAAKRGQRGLGGREVEPGGPPGPSPRALSRSRSRSASDVAGHRGTVHNAAPGASGSRGLAVTVTGAEATSERAELTGGVVPDAARQHAYVSFAGPLGVHLKQEVKEKIWKGDFCEIFSLLPLEDFIDLKEDDKKDEKKEEEEKKKRYRKIPKSFGNWLRAFCVLASVLGEKSPGLCSSLFCYLDGIWEAYRTYGGLAWWRYDEQFRQRLAANPGMRWDQMDLPLWMKLMMAQKAQPFQPTAGAKGQSASSAAMQKGFCWLFNEGQCKWGNACRFKHECSGCGGAHGLNRCFKKGKAVELKYGEGHMVNKWEHFSECLSN
ncbi:collagen alpha-1(II) chain-like isoform X1, partial [Pelobates cultripes]